MRGPVVGGAEQDVAGEVPQRARDVVEAADDLEVFVPGREPARDAALPSVDQGEREGPRRRRGPRHRQQGPPGETDGEGGAVRHDGDRHQDGGRRAGSQMRVPRRQQRGPVDVERVARPLDVTADQDGGGHEQDGGPGRVQVPARDAGRGGACGRGRGPQRCADHTGTLGRTAGPGRETGHDVRVSSWVKNPFAGWSRPTFGSCETTHAMHAMYGIQAMYAIRGSPRPPASGAAPCAAPGSPRCWVWSCSSASPCCS